MALRRTAVTLVGSVLMVAGVLVGIAPPTGAGSVWSIVTSENPKTYPSSLLFDVTCPRTNDCFAVGKNGKTTGPFMDANTLVEHWDGSSWSVMHSPTPNPADDVALDGVSCPTTRSCFAVGSIASADDSGPAPETTLVERWDGTHWSVMPSPNATPMPASFLDDVSCPSTTSCFAVGAETNTDDTAVEALVEHWNGSSWSIVAGPETPQPVSFLSGVSCPSTDSCFAVGFDRGTDVLAAQTLVEHWNGSSWSIVPSPSPTALPNSELNDVSCATTNNCSAVGDNQNFETGSGKTLAEHWNGTSWSITPTPNPSVHPIRELVGVSCPTTSSCVAVGFDATQDRESGVSSKTLIEQFNGAHWSIVSSLDPAVQPASFLAGVSCPTANNCVAVGERENKFGSFSRTLVEQST